MVGIGKILARHLVPAPPLDSLNYDPLPISDEEIMTEGRQGPVAGPVGDLKECGDENLTATGGTDLISNEPAVCRTMDS